MARIGAGTEVATTAGSGISLSPHANTVVGNFMLALLITKDNSTISIPSGWTQLYQENNGANMRTCLAWRRYQSGDANMSFTNSSSTVLFFGVIESYDCYDNSPIDSSSNSVNGNGTTVTCLAITPTLDGCTLIFIGIVGDNDTVSANFGGTNPSPSAGLDVRTIVGTDAAIFTANGVKTDHTTTGNRTATIDQTNGIANNSGYMIALKPITKKSLSDTTGGSDSLPTMKVKISQSDSFSGSDSLSQKNRMTLSDVAGCADAIAKILNRTTLSDSFSGSETISSLVAKISRSESASGSDAISNITVRLSHSDSFSGSDSLSSLFNKLIILDDGEGLDSVSVFQSGGNASKSLSDAATALETLSVKISFALSESGSANDSVQLLNRLLLSDVASGSDLIQKIINRLTVLEVVSGQESIGMLNTKLSQSEIATSADQIASLVIRLTQTDNASASDTLSITRDGGFSAKSLSDAASAVDSLSVKIRIALSESGVAGDAFGLFNKISASENAYGNDIVSRILAKISLSDLLSGADVCAVSNGDVFLTPLGNIVLNRPRRNYTLTAKRRFTFDARREFTYNSKSRR